MQTSSFQWSILTPSRFGCFSNLNAVRVGEETKNLDDALRDILKDLGASPVRIYGKKLRITDRDLIQHRLLISCRSWRARHGLPCPLDEILTEEEKARTPTKDGFRIRAYDRHGKPYNLRRRNFGRATYRLFAGWGAFLKENGLGATKGDAVAGEHAMVELWAFRSPRLDLGVENQPCGQLGLVMVHYRQGDAPHADAVIAEILAEEENGALAIMPAPAATEDANGYNEDAVPVLEDVLVDARENPLPVMVIDGAEDPVVLWAAGVLVMMRHDNKNVISPTTSASSGNEEKEEEEK